MSESTNKPLTVEALSLAPVIQGRGEKRGYVMLKLIESDRGFLYTCKHEKNGNQHYEVFKRSHNKRFNCISYPGSSAFGLWAWSYISFDRAAEKFDTL